jgi:hypothetical protein
MELIGVLGFVCCRTDHHCALVVYVLTVISRQTALDPETRPRDLFPAPFVLAKRRPKNC